MIEPLVSVVMPAYRAEAFIGEAINSMLGQTYRNWELIVCADGSEDSTFRVAEFYAKEDDRIKVSLHERGGYAKTFNEALIRCNGEFIARLDADDRQSPERIERQARVLIERSWADIVTCNMHRFTGDGHIIECPNIGPMDAVGYCQGDTSKGVISPSIMARRTVYDSVGRFREHREWSADSDWNLRVLCHDYSWDHLPDVLYYYRQHNGRMTKRNFRQQRADYAAACEEFRAVILERIINGEGRT